MKVWMETKKKTKTKLVVLKKVKNIKMRNKMQLILLTNHR